jgi:hypothetical protein
MRAVALAGLTTLALSGCGEVAGDLFAVVRSGSVPGAAFAASVRDDGTVTCNGRRRALPGPLLLAARQLQRDLALAAANSVALRPGRQPVFFYTVLTSAGRISFADDSPGNQPVFFRLAEFTRQVARQVCGLAR